MHLVRPQRLLAAAIFAAAILSAPVAGRSADGDSDAAAITHVLQHTWDRPDAPLRIDPIVVAGDHAIAGWTQGDMGGRALMRRKDGAWDILLCGGDALKHSDTLKKIGVPPIDAARLAEQLAAAESRSDPQRVVQFSRFEGLVTMNGAATSK